MKFNIAGMALIVLGLAFVGCAAPAVPEIEKADSHLSPRALELACIDLWEYPGQQRVIQKNLCNRQDICVPWQYFRDQEQVSRFPYPTSIGSMNFEGTCCEIYDTENCNWKGDFWVMCKPGDVPFGWREKIRSYSCYLPGDWAKKRRNNRSSINAAAAEVVKIAGAVPPLPLQRLHASAHHVSRDVAAASSIDKTIIRTIDSTFSTTTVSATRSSALDTVSVHHTASTQTIVTPVTGLPWNFPTSGWLSGSGSAITWSTKANMTTTTTLMPASSFHPNTFGLPIIFSTVLQSLAPQSFHPQPRHSTPPSPTALILQP